MDRFPHLGVFLFSVALILTATALGTRIGRRDRARHPDDVRTHSAAAIGATLGLLAFMLAITFNSAISRFDARKQLVLEEANAIGTTYLRADVLKPPYREQAKCLLQDYVNVRLQLNDPGNSETTRSSIAKAEALHQRLWQLAISATEQQPTDHTALYLEANNALIDLHQERLTVGLEYRLPHVFWVTLYLLLAITMLMGGYDTGFAGNRRTYNLSLPLAIAFALILSLVVTLDRPSKLFQLNQQPLRDVQASMAAAPAACNPIDQVVKPI